MWFSLSSFLVLVYIINRVPFYIADYLKVLDLILSCVMSIYWMLLDAVFLKVI